MKFGFAAGLLLVLLIAGCGGSGSSSSPSSSSSSAPATPSSTATAAPAGGSPATLKLAADPGGQLKFDASSLAASAGKVTIDFTNSSPLPHNLTIASSTGTVVGATPTFQGGTKVLTLDLKAGTYTFYCSVPGHRQAGMHGTLVVK